MNHWRAQTQFQKADDFYRQKRFEEALRVLDTLDTAFPNTRNIMLPRARCLRHLNRPQEAMEICDHLIDRFGDEKAVKLKNAIASAQAAAERDSSIGFAPLRLEDLGLDSPTPPPAPPPPKRQWKAPVLAVLALMVALVLGVLFWVLRLRVG